MQALLSAMSICILHAGYPELSCKLCHHEAGATQGPPPFIGCGVCRDITQSPTTEARAVLVSWQYGHSTYCYPEAACQSLSEGAHGRGEDVCEGV